jgi:hypothetical protein
MPASFAAARKCRLWPIASLRGIEKNGRFRGQSGLERGFFGAVAARHFSEKDFVRRPTQPQQPVLLSDMPLRTAHSCSKYDARYYR